jgi:four helix bundle protein
MQSFRDLKVWNKSHELALVLYKITSKFPKEELFGLISQIRRAVISISTNIAEGCGRGSNPDFNRFLQIALGSASELESLLILSKDLGYLSEKDFPSLVDQVIEIKKMLASLSIKVRNSSK